ncbi:hypothetical protein HJC23_010542 [Cyclotella cryptica]|uniref:Uncharacterized protein n=1 Tax=Cyclotella cryptica TaxID=29204 RepID=A0ABD3QCF2_9STRA|eukprot:CCRYP_007126-RA/>CCRYP_007126-RA protein AED:0.00 eAED:0.00 QI:176/1/1/1/1/1/2/288/290
MEPVTTISPTNPVDMDQLSPITMAAQAYTAAVADRERHEKSKRSAEEGTIPFHDEDDAMRCTRPTKLFKSREDSSHEEGEYENTTERGIEEIWKSGDNEANLAETLRLLTDEIDSMVQCGLGAFHDLDVASRQLLQSKELAETRSREAQRFHAVEDQNRASLSKLLRAVEASKSNARDSSRAAQIESRLRNEISKLRYERDEANADLIEHRRKLSLHEEELRLTKSKLNRIIQEKHSMERDSRAAISLARSLDHNNSNDMNYYKRKVGELSDKLQVAQRRVAELTDKLQA